MSLSLGVTVEGSVTPLQIVSFRLSELSFFNSSGVSGNLPTTRSSWGGSRLGFVGLVGGFRTSFFWMLFSFDSSFSNLETDDDDDDDDDDDGDDDGDDAGVVVVVDGGRTFFDLGVK